MQHSVRTKGGLETLYGGLGDNSGLIGPPSVKRFNMHHPSVHPCKVEREHERLFHVRIGSFATDALGAPLGTMSAVPPKADIRFERIICSDGPTTDIARRSARAILTGVFNSPYRPN
jgi:hypothetical protein